MTLLTRLALFLLVGAASVAPLAAEPLSKSTEIDFFRDIPSRNLKGLAARADGRLVAGPVLTELTGATPADLFWCLEPTADANRWLVGSGPDGKIFAVTLDVAHSTYTTQEVAQLAESHIFALARLPDEALLVGTSPRGALVLVRGGQPVARVALPVDSIFDLLLSPDAQSALVATGNPARIYRVDLAAFALAGLNEEKLTDPALLAAKGIHLFGEVRDRNLRRLARMADGRIAAGSAPKGNVYTFAADGGSPTLLQENRDAEVTDLRAEANGDLYAVLTYSGLSGESRITPPVKPAVKDAGEIIFPAALPPAAEKFSGRSALVWFPSRGFPETLTSRNNAALYRISRHGDALILAGGEQGELLGFDVAQRTALTFPGSPAAQLNGLAPLAGRPGQFLLLHNNAPGFALLDFNASAAREAETRRLELNSPALLGALRFDRVRDVADEQISVEIKINQGSDELEGWTPWTALAVSDGGWSAPDLRGRNVKVRFKLPASATHAQLAKATLFNLPQNRRPQLQDFHLLSPNFGLVPAAAPSPNLTTTLGQLVQNRDQDDDKRKSRLLSSQILPVPGAQVVFWNASDPDDDRFLATFSIRREGTEAWTDLAVASPESYVQFDTAHLPDGVYFTRLVLTETTPRPTPDRLTASFDTDDLVVDHTPPQILDAKVARTATHAIITVHGRDTRSLLAAVEATFNSGYQLQTEQPADGILDSREETFVLELPLAQASGATSVEVTLYDAAGNAASQRLTL